MTRKKRNHKYITLISLLLIMAFTNLIISPLYPALKGGTSIIYNLHPQMMSKPILYDEIGDKGMLAFTIMQKIRRDPNILRSEISSDNLFSDLGPETVRVYFSNIEEFEFDDIRMFIIRCRAGDKDYFAHLLLYRDGQMKIALYSEEEYADIRGELEGKLSAETVRRLLEKVLPCNLAENETVHFVDVTDESVRAVMAFLGKVEAKNVNREIQDIVSARKLLLIEQPLFVAEGIVVAEAADEKVRAVSILENVLSKKGIERRKLAPVFERFWELWKKGQAEEFDPDKIDPGFNLSIRETERKSGDASNEGYADSEGNRGMIRFSDKAYESRLSTVGVELSDCVKTIADIKRIFREVALHEIRKHNEAVEKLKIPEGEKATRRIPEDTLAVPGMDPDKIVIRKLTNCLLPSDLIMTEEVKTEGGSYRTFKEIRIHENFVRIMHKLRFTGIKDEKLGKVYDSSGKPLGEIYSSIIYALAIHTIRGHFPINEYGFVAFNPDEFLAQRERGGKHLYVNLLAMMYYWITVVERSKYPGERADVFMKNYPQVFAGLTKKEKQKLPKDLVDICFNLIQHNAWHIPSFRIPTDITAEDVAKVFRENPGAVSNEGEPGKARGEDENIIPGSLLAGVFRLLYGESKALTGADIAGRLEGPGISIVSRCLDVLVESGIVAADPKAEEKAYKAVFMSSPRRSQVEEILKTDRDKGKIYEIIEPVWADAVLDTLVYGRTAQKIKARGQKMVLALETDWIPEEQKVFIQQLVQSLEELGVKDTVRIVRGTGDTLATNLMKAVEEENAPLQNVIVLASQGTLEKEEFDPIRAKHDNDTNKAFLAGVDAGSLRGDSYIRLLEMVTMAVRMANGQRPVSEHHNIEVIRKNSRTFIFIPRAEPLDYDHLKKIYDSQMKILAAA